jgi:predicted RNase H-like HicB family nuclease
MVSKKSKTNCTSYFSDMYTNLYIFPPLLVDLLFAGQIFHMVAIDGSQSTDTFGDSVADAVYMAQDAVEMWLWDAENKKEPIPSASNQKIIAKQCKGTNYFVSLVAADTDEYRRRTETRAVKKTHPIPSWLNDRSTEKANAPFSQILQEGLKEYLHVS